METTIIIILAVAVLLLLARAVVRARYKQALQHVETFVRNKIREGYQGDSPEYSAKENVLHQWGEYGHLGANAQASRRLGGKDQAIEIINATIDKILGSKIELEDTLEGRYFGSQEHLIGMIQED